MWGYIDRWQSSNELEVCNDTTGSEAILAGSSSRVFDVGESCISAREKSARWSVMVTTTITKQVQ